MRRLLSCLLASCALLYCACAAGAAPGCDEKALRDEAHRAKTWRYAWSGINAGLMIGSFAVVPLVERESRPDWIVSGIGSGVTVLGTWLWPLRVEAALEELDALPPERRQVELPRLLRESAEDEHARVTWPWHLLNVGLSAAAGSIVAFGYKHYWSGAITAVAGTALGEVQLFTQPTGLPRACPVGALRGCHQTTWLLAPRLGWTPRLGAVPAAWTLGVGGTF
jgi:hypothetical protein